MLGACDQPGTLYVTGPLISARPTPKELKAIEAAQYRVPADAFWIRPGFDATGPIIAVSNYSVAHEGDTGGSESGVRIVTVTPEGGVNEEIFAISTEGC